MSSQLDELIKRAKGHAMTDEEREQQRQSFAYGNTKIENERITRDSIKQAAESMARQDSEDGEKND